MEGILFLPLQFNQQQHLPNQFLWTISWGEKKNPNKPWRDTPEEGIFSHRPPSVLQLEAAQQEQPQHTLQVGLGHTKTTLVTSQPGHPVLLWPKVLNKSLNAALRVHSQSGFRFKSNFWVFLHRERIANALELLLHQQGFP